MKRIVFVFRAPIGGLFRNVYDVSMELAGRGYDVGVICDESDIAPKWQGMLNELKANCTLGVVQIPIVRGPNILDFYSAFLIWKHLNRMRPDIVHGHGAKGGLFARFCGSFVKSKPGRLYTAHGGSLQFATRAYEGKIYHTVEKFLYSQTDAIVCESDYIRRMFIEKIGAIPVLHRVIFNGLNEYEFEVRTVKDNPYDFLFLAEFTFRKGYDIFVKAMAKIKLKHPDFTALCVGSGPEEQKFKDLVSRAGLIDNVTFHPPMPAAEAFAISKILVIPSRAESMPYAILEAAACEMPIISTDVGGIPEIFKEGSTVGLTKNENICEFEEAMERFLNAPDIFYAAAKSRREFVHKYFNMVAMVDDIVKIYNDALVVRRAT